MRVPDPDRTVLRTLAEDLASISSAPVNVERAELWRRLNDLEPVRPLVWINEIPWHEMDVDDELTIRCQSTWAQALEQQFRRTVYQWRHMAGDMVVDPYLSSPIIYHSTGLGVQENVEVARTDDRNPIVSRHFNIQISEPEDIEIIKDPVVTVDHAATEEVLDLMTDIFGDIMPIRQTGITGIWFTPWDNLIRLWGVQEAMMDLALRPEMVNAIVARFVEASMRELDQFEELGLLYANNANRRVGSGGYAYTKGLPLSSDSPVTPDRMWGCSNAQIFSGVSPDMHWDFALRHDLPWLERWGMNYYGCCEPLDRKMEIMRRIPRLRKISMSPWAPIDRAVQAVGHDFVMSRKPNPACLAEDEWKPERVRAELAAEMDAAADVNMEVILKDISTVRYDPQRLWDWESVAMDEARKRERG